MNESENDIVRRAISEESAAFGVLYDKYHSQIYRFIYLKTGNREEAEDLTHQVFLSAWKNIKQYEIKKFPFSSWLYRIAKNKVIDYYRLSRQHFNIELVKNDILTKENINEDISNSINYKAIIDALNHLSPEQQDVIIMRFVDDLPIKEVAVAINKTPSAVKLIQLRAIKKIKKIINPDNNE